MKRRCLINCLVLVVVCAVAYAGPFGMEWGMTKEQLENVGTLELQHQEELFTSFDFIPKKSHSAFESYQLILGTDEGLVKIVAYGNDITCNDYGTQLKSEFNSMKDSLVKNYGKVSNTFDFNSSSTWDEADDWMMSLYLDKRVFAVFWELQDISIMLEAKATSSSKGYIKLTYENDKWGEILDRRSASERSLL